MHIKRFTGATVKEAMKAIRAEFGEDALILSTKRVPGGHYEITAAIDYDLSRTDNPHSSNQRLNVHPAGGARPKKGIGMAAQADDATGGESKELEELNELCLKFKSAGNAQGSRFFLNIREDFLANGIDKRLSRKILTTTLKDVPPERLTDENFLRSLIRSKMLENIRVCDPLSKKGVVVFVGPSGVGKTTTIAKLAADQALKKKKSLALLTMDTYRIAAAEQLKIYGKIMGVTVEVARNSVELASRIGSHRDKDLVLVDTAGGSQRNSAHMGQMKEIAEISRSIRFNLVLSSQTRDEGLYDSIKGFCGALPVDSLTFTKLDEALVHGPILNSMLLARKPVSYLGHGQRVPDDITLATKEKLLQLFMSI